ncbi:MAG: bifunctional phosphoribosyl-AMP cyclohydrolase/phosphoribosyl-ATP diphosphatase HisIE [Prevotellaceae bacterium]|jgi:phosphoribosyl-ATP pyrophosphohydrolase/phosphoribosyl-AMP cyclohydrolase|nr:bifunctional phosphoribosyl-AMP cyclohydrolase/phosphoribosyl-ATP diphosphatase HisIE [Prevotellaceae bacterium]
MLKLSFDKDGLIPVIVQDYYSREVLTLAYMNAESLIVSITEGKTCFYSRSRSELWRKGETSGNVQRIVRMYADCDCDAMVVEVIKDGPACHTGSETCFTTPVYISETVCHISLHSLFELLRKRNESRPADSYTTYLFNQGLDKILKKVGEECVEVVIGAKNSKEELVYELADLQYHLMVLMINQGIEIKDIIDELASRSIIDKKDKQAGFDNIVKIEQ